MGLKSAFTAKDAQIGASLPLAGNKVTFPLARRDFRTIALEVGGGEDVDAQDVPA